MSGDVMAKGKLVIDERKREMWEKKEKDKELPSEQQGPLIGRKYMQITPFWMTGQTRYKGREEQE